MSTAVLTRPSTEPAGSSGTAPGRGWSRFRPSTPQALFLGFLALYALIAAWLVLGEHSVMEDAISRVANASYVVDSRQPKLANVGFVWTPLPSLLVLPFLPLQHLWPALVGQGLLANALSAVAMAASVRVLHGLLGDLRVGKRVSLALAVLFGLQPMIVWFGANGMTEALLVLFLLLASRNLVRWRGDGDPRHLMAAGAWLALGYLSRYEVLAAGCAAVVLVIGLTWTRTRGTRAERRSAAAADALLVGSPLVAAFLLWAGASWATVGHPFEQFSSEYGNSALVSSEGMAASTNTGLLVVQLLVLAPLLPIALVGAAYRAGSRRDLSVLPPVFLLGAVLAFEAMIYTAGSLFGFLRYQIAAIPLFFVLVGFLLAEGPFPAVVAVGRRRWSRSRRAGEREPGDVRSRTHRRVLLGIAVGAGLPGILTSSLAFMNSPTLASQEWGHVRPAVLSLGGDEQPTGAGSGNGNGTFEVDRDVAAYLDAKQLPDGSVAIDSGSGFAVLAATDDPRQFVITSDQDFDGAVADPIGHGVQYLLLNRSASQFDEIAATWPDLAAGAAEEPWATLDVVFPVTGGPGAHEWVLWRVDPTT